MKLSENVHLPVASKDLFFTGTFIYVAESWNGDSEQDCIIFGRKPVKQVGGFCCRQCCAAASAGAQGTLRPVVFSNFTLKVVFISPFLVTQAFR